MELKEKNKLAYQKIKEAQKTLLVTHERPDGDALASVCAMSVFLDSINKDHQIYCHDEPSLMFNFIPNIEKVKSQKNFIWKDFDLIIILDCGAMSRTRLEEEIKSKTEKQFIIEFDHHPMVDHYANIEIKIPGLSSTAEVLYYFFKDNQLPFSKSLSTCILSGILTDTINFLNTSTTAETIAISSEMLSCGAQMPKINRFAWKNKNIHSMKLLGAILDNLKINKKYNFAFSCLTHQEMKTFGEIEESFDSVMNFLANIDDVKAIMLLREERPGQIKGSFRTNHPDIDISKLAKKLNGGGHAKASGFKVKGKILKTQNSWKVI